MKCGIAALSLFFKIIMIEYLTSTLVRRRRIHYSLLTVRRRRIRYSLFVIRFFKVSFSIKLAAVQAGGDACMKLQIVSSMI